MVKIAKRDYWLLLPIGVFLVLMLFLPIHFVQDVTCSTSNQAKESRCIQLSDLLPASYTKNNTNNFSYLIDRENHFKNYHGTTMMPNTSDEDRDIYISLATGIVLAVVVYLLQNQKKPKSKKKS